MTEFIYHPPTHQYVWDDELVEDFPDPRRDPRFSRFNNTWIDPNYRQFWVSKYGYDSVTRLREFRQGDRYVVNINSLRGVRAGVLNCPGTGWDDFPADQFPISTLKMIGIYRIDFYTDQFVVSLTI